MSWKDLFCLILKGTWLAIGMEDSINELEGPILVTDSEIEASMGVCITSSRSGVAGATGDEAVAAACHVFRASSTADRILESSLSRSWSNQAGCPHR